MEFQLFLDSEQIEENVVLRTITHRSTEHLPVDQNSAGGLLENADQTVEDGTLSRAIRPEKRGNLILVQIEGDVVHRDLVGSEAFDQMFDTNDGSRHRQWQLLVLVTALSSPMISLEEEIPIQRHSVFPREDLLHVPRAECVEDRTADHHQQTRQEPRNVRVDRAKEVNILHRQIVQDHLLDRSNRLLRLRREQRSTYSKERRTTEERTDEYQEILETRGPEKDAKGEKHRDTVDEQCPERCSNHSIEELSIEDAKGQ